jgi:hypothetical protein
MRQFMRSSLINNVLRKGIEKVAIDFNLVAVIKSTTGNSDTSISNGNYGSSKSGCSIVLVLVPPHTQNMQDVSWFPVGISLSP